MHNISSICFKNGTLFGLFAASLAEFMFFGGAKVWIAGSLISVLALQSVAHNTPEEIIKVLWTNEKKMKLVSYFECGFFLVTFFPSVYFWGNIIANIGCWIYLITSILCMLLCFLGAILTSRIN